MASESLGADVRTRLYVIFFVLAVQLSGEALSWFAWRTGSVVLVASSLVVWVLWFPLVLLVAGPSAESTLGRRPELIRFTGRGVALVMALVATGGLTFILLANHGFINGGELGKSLTESVRYGDDTALVHQASNQVLSGVNPYAEADVLSAMEAFDVPASRATPLRAGSFEHLSVYPTDEQLTEVLNENWSSTGESPPEIASKLCYPAGSFVLPAPLIAMGLGDIRLFYLLCALAIVGLALLWTPPDLRLLVLAVCVTNVILWLDVASGRTDSLYVLLILLGWVLRRHLLLSALFMGLAAATKQIAWVYILFFLILQTREVGWKQALRAFGLISLTFLAVNLPFVYNAPQAWLSGIAAEFGEPYFPRGVGIVVFTSVHLLPANQTMFAILQGLVLLLSATWYYFSCRRYPHIGLLLAALPFFFAWHSYSRYLYFAPLLILIALIAEGTIDGAERTPPRKAATAN